MPTQRAARWKLSLWSSSLACRISYAPDLQSSTGDRLSKQDRERTGGEISEPPRDGFPAIEVDVLQQVVGGSGHARMRGSARLARAPVQCFHFGMPEVLATGPAQKLPSQG